MNNEPSKRGRRPNQITDFLSSPEEKGKRLKRARTLSGLTREQLSTISGVNIHTLIGWECGRFGGISRNGAEKISKGLELEGVLCSIEWLLYGTGDDPNVRVSYQKIKNEIEYDNVLAKLSNTDILNEILFFRKLHRDSTDMIVSDDGMLPFYRMGDCIAGIKRYDDIKLLIGLDCIVETSHGCVLFRNLQPGPGENTYNLLCTNLYSSINNKISYNMTLVYAAPVIWIRRVHSELD